RFHKFFGATCGQSLETESHPDNQPQRSDYPARAAFQHIPAGSRSLPPNDTALRSCHVLSKDLSDFFFGPRRNPVARNNLDQGKDFPAAIDSVGRSVSFGRGIESSPCNCDTFLL